MTRPIWIIGGNLAGLITAFRLLPYGFHLHILERRTAPQIMDHTDVIPPVWPGFYHATWSLLQELSLPLPRFHTGPIEILFSDGQRSRIPRVPPFAALHLLPEVLLFRGLHWRDRLNLLTHLEKAWEHGTSDEAVSDTQPAETWVKATNQSHAAQQDFWNPLCRWLLGCDLSEGSLRMFVTTLSRYAQTTSTGTQWFFGSDSLTIDLKAGLRELLIKQGVQFHACEEYPAFRSVGGNGETFSLTGETFSGTAMYVASLPPEEILPLLPERTLTKYSQLDRMAHIPSHTRMFITCTIPDLRLPRSLILCPNDFDWITIVPSGDSFPPETLVICQLRQTTEPSLLGAQTPIEKIWANLHSLLHLPQRLSRIACPPQLQTQLLRLFPSSAGSRGFRPHNTSPIPNFFLVGPWTDTAFPHSMESLVQSANACAEAIAHRFFSSLR